MTTTSRAHDPVASSPLAVVAGVAMRQLAPDTARTLPLDDRCALVFVQFGVLAIGGPKGRRALPGEWVRASAVEQLAYANASRTEELRVCEVVFSEPGDAPDAGIEQRYFSDDERADQLCPVAGREGSQGALALGLDAMVHVATLGRWSTVLYDLQPGRGAWVFVLSGDASVNNEKLESGADAFIVDKDEVRISGGSGADVMLVDAACPTAASAGAADAGPREQDQTTNG